MIRYTALFYLLLIIGASCSSEQSEVCENGTNGDAIDQDNWTCSQTPDASNSYQEMINGDIRTIITNGIPTHDYRNQIPDIVSSLNASTKIFKMDLTPSVAATLTGIVNANNMPAYDLGVATSGVPIDPAPGPPFIFVNGSTGVYNWDWVMEPTNNMMEVGLDCAIAHVQPDGVYHYHGDMGVYADQLSPGISSGTIPTAPVQVGWAADGFPILYKYGPDASGAFRLLQPSYQLKKGERPGDGISAPCGAYNGKYTNDYEYVDGIGDLDTCNGIKQNVTIGSETFGYFYVITSSFPAVPRCISGTPDTSFKK